MNSKAIIAAGVASLAASVSTASVILRNPYYPDGASLAFDWDIKDTYGPTGWIEHGGYVESVGESANIDDQSCGCPDGFTAPCYESAIASTADWTFF